MSVAAALAIAIAGTSFGFAEESSKCPTIGEIERVDPRVDALLPADAVIEVLAEGFDWAEGPVWVPQREIELNGYLLFSDVPQNTVYKWWPPTGVTVFLRPSGYTGKDPRGGESGSNGLVLDPQGRLVLCQHGDRRIARWDRGGFVTLADNYRGKPFNSPNDAVFKSNGDLYFTDPPYGMTPETREAADALGFCGVYRLSTDGTVTLLTDKMTRPNGIAFSPDETILYVAQSDPENPVWMAFPVKDDGTLGEGRVFFDAKPWVEAGLKGLPDGMKVDRQGNLWATGPGGVNIIAPDGTFLGRLKTGVATANCAFGEDGSALYITADRYLLRIRTTTKGLGFE
ncbi:SMP-30/gluconolactonase/LRE family protein [Thermostilla marina]